MHPANPLARHPFDEQFGVDTGGLIFGRDLAHGEATAPEITGYAGVSVSRFELVLGHWRTLAGETRIPEFAFADIGCGKGRALMLASRWPFREVWGVELDRSLAAIAHLLP